MELHSTYKKVNIYLFIGVDYRYKYFARIGEGMGSVKSTTMYGIKKSISQQLKGGA